ncbi:MAG: MBL fold metallo-hydrolase, partial [Coriobacteriales bacterium]|nr:MBL fold metallo-hydrolase [Coriobacteriales bacterium]
MTSFTTPHNARRVAGDTLVVGGLTNSGFIEGLVIDTGDDFAPYAGVVIDSLAITHGHADHFSVAHAVRADGAAVWVGRDDASLVENPDINIRGMFSWAKPAELLTTRLFIGEPCTVDRYVEDWDDARAEAIPLPGHTLGHHGFLTRDGVLFTGDALYLEDIWARHPLPYAIDPSMVAESLEVIRSLECDWLVPAHCRIIARDEADHHIDYHLDQIETIRALLLDRLATEKTTEQAIALVSAERGLLENPAAYWLAVTTVKGYLGDLLDRGE